MITFTDTFPDNMLKKFVILQHVANTSKFGDELRARRKGRRTSLHPCEGDMIHGRVRVHQSGLWLVDDSVDVSLRYVWTRDRMMWF